MSTKSAARTIILLDGLNDIEQAAIARDYESRTGRPFRCQLCSVARPGDKADDEPAAEVIAVVNEAGEMTPLCEACYEEFQSGAIP